MMGFVRGTTIFLGLLALFALCADGAPGERKLIKRSAEYPSDYPDELLDTEEYPYNDDDQPYDPYYEVFDGEEGVDFELSGVSNIATDEEDEQMDGEEQDDISIHGGQINQVNQWESGQTGGQGNGQGASTRPKACPKCPRCTRGKPNGKSNRGKGKGKGRGKGRGKGKKRVKANDVDDYATDLVNGGYDNDME